MDDCLVDIDKYTKK